MQHKNMSISAGQETEAHTLSLTKAIQAVMEGVSAGDINDLLQVADSFHFITATYVLSALRWFEQSAAGQARL